MHEYPEDISRTFKPIALRDPSPVDADGGSSCSLETTQQALAGNALALGGLKNGNLAISPQNRDRFTALGATDVAADPIPKFSDFNASHLVNIAN